jgi:hypothetical protein
MKGFGTVARSDGSESLDAASTAFRRIALPINRNAPGEWRFSANAKPEWRADPRANSFERPDMKQKTDLKPIWDVSPNNPVVLERLTVCGGRRAGNFGNLKNDAERSSPCLLPALGAAFVISLQTGRR